MNTELLKDVQDAILDNPEHLNMGRWYHHNCKTTACIAGWTVAVQNDIHVSCIDPGDDETVREHVITTLVPKNLTFEEYVQQKLELSLREADELFYICEWPTNFFRAYDDAKTPEGRAYAAACRISKICPEIDRPPDEYLPEDDKWILSKLN